MSLNDPDQDKLNKENTLKLFYACNGNLDDINKILDAKLKTIGSRKITIFEDFLKSRLALNPRILKMPQMEISSLEAVYLCQYPSLDGLEVLDLRKNFIGDEGLEAISHSTLFSKLKVLDLRNNGITRLGMKVLGESNRLECLEKIDLRSNKLGNRWEDKLRETGNFPKLIDLKIA